MINALVLITFRTVRVLQIQQRFDCEARLSAAPCLYEHEARRRLRVPAYKAQTLGLKPCLRKIYKQLRESFGPVDETGTAAGLHQICRRSA